MTERERITGAVVLVLAAVGGWFAWQLSSSGGLTQPAGGSIFLAVFAITVLTAIGAALAALVGRGRTRVDERDHRIALRAQFVRGFLYLALAFALLGLAMMSGNALLANVIFLAILGIEIVSGLVMLALYRMSA